MDILNKGAASVLFTFVLMVLFQWYNRRQMQAKEDTRFKKHLCTQLYEANLVTSLDTELIQRELYVERGSGRDNRMFKLYHDNMANVEFRKEQLENIAPKIKQITSKLKEGTLTENFYDVYARVLLEEIEDDQLSNWPAEDIAFFRKMREKTRENNNDKNIL